MQRLLAFLDQWVRGPVAVVCVVVGLVCLAALILLPLPWGYFPNVIQMLRVSWLYLVIIVAIAYAGAVAVAKRRGVPVEMATCVVVGLLWKFVPVFKFIPFNFSRWLIVYGLAGLTAHCLRKAFAGRSGMISTADPAVSAPRDSVPGEPK